jgi:prolyl 4-hydroxylase
MILYKMKQMLIVILLFVLFFISVYVLLLETRSTGVEGYISGHKFNEDISGPVVPYQIITIPGLFSKSECEYVMKKMEGKLTRSTVVGKSNTNDISQDRTSMTGWIKPTDAVLGKFAKKLISIGSALTGIRDMNRFEDISIVRYEATQEYKGHYDACSTKTYCGDNLRIYRTATLILYLNDDFEDGGTNFPKIGKTITPETGKVALFYNTDADGVEIPESLHAGLPVKSGVKWICTLWIKFIPTEEQIKALNEK